MLRQGLADENPRSAIGAVRAFGELLRFSGVGPPELLAVAADAAGKLGETALQADCLWALGDIARWRSDHDTARARFEQAQRLYEQAGNIIGQANCLYGLGDIALARSDHDTAQARYQEALALYAQISSLIFVGWTHRLLARLAPTDGQRALHVKAARAAWTSIDRTDLVEELTAEFGDD
jgi:tetratricopeptide (TPR) repeat protein